MLLPPEMVEQIPPVARYHRVPLADEDNAYGIWQDAAKKFIPYDDRLSPYFWCSASVFPRGSLGREVKAWLDANEESLRLYRAGAQRQGWQLPEFTLHDDFEAASKLERLNEIRGFAWLIRQHVRRCLSEHKFDEATRAAIDQLHAGRMFCCGDGLVVHYLCGIALHGIGLELIHEIATHRRCPAGLVHTLAAAVREDLDADDGFEKSLQVELLYNLRYVALMPDGDNSKELANQLLAAIYSREPILVMDSTRLDEYQTAIESDRRVEQRDNDVRFLVSGHPNPFDRRLTTRLFAEQAARDIECSRKPRHCNVARNVEEDPLAGIWPDQLRSWFPLQCLGDSEQARSECEGDYECIVKQGTKYPTRDELTYARDQIMAVPNPIGWALWNEMRASSYVWVRLQKLASRRCHQVLLALCAYRIQHDCLPKQLEELVSAGLLSEVPLDPFDDESLRYCWRRQIVWSVGRDGIDDGGDAGHKWDGSFARDIVVSARIPGRWRRWRDRWMQWRAIWKSREEIKYVR